MTGADDFYAGTKTAISFLSGKFLVFLIALAVACYYIGCWSASFIQPEFAIALTGLVFLAGCVVYDVALARPHRRLAMIQCRYVMAEKPRHIAVHIPKVYLAVVG